MRTKPGLRKVSYIDHAPYSGAPTSKRHRNPKPYGKHVIILKVVNPITGEESITSQFVHGNGDESSIGKKISQGCTRVKNSVMNEELSKEVTRGDFVLFINPDPDCKYEK